MYKVEKIIGKRSVTKKRGGFEYLVKWEGWDIKDSTWEPEKHLQYVPDLIEQFQRKSEEKSLGISDSSEPQMVNETQSTLIKKPAQQKPSSIKNKQSYQLSYQDKCSPKQNQKRLDFSSLITVTDLRKKEKKKASKEILISQKTKVSQATNYSATHSNEGPINPQSKGKKEQKNIKILGMKKEGSQFWYYVVEGNGKESWVVRDYMIEHYASELCKFYEERIVFST